MMIAKLPYRLVAFDLDNTTLYRGEMSASTKRALQALRKRGVITVAATGRHISLIPASIQRNKNIDYIICVTGSSIYRVQTREMTHLCHMTNEQAQIAVDICKNLNAKVNLVTKERAFAEKAAFQSFVKSSAVKGKSHGKTSLKQVLRLLKMVFASSLMDDAAGYLERHPYAGVQKIDAFFDDDAQTEDAVRLLLKSGNFEVAESSRYLEITGKGCNKGTGLQRLYQRIGYTSDDAIAFGDSGNDLSMAVHVKLFVAMGNAEPAVLQRADLIAPDVRDDGFAAVVSDLFAIE
jgi:Cof subfamily protein (haloacid dehalogenase superfamily)